MSKLLLIFALAVLSYARTRPIVKDTDAASIYFDSQKIVNDVVTINYTEIDDASGFSTKVKIADITPISTATAADTNYLPIVKNEFSTYKTSLPWYVVPEGGDAGVPCRVVESIHNDGTYGLYGYAAKIIKKVDLAPSIAALIKFGPGKVTYSDLPEGEDDPYYADRNNAKTCTDPYVIDDLSFGLNTYGIYDAGCIRNTVIPTDAITQCEDITPTSNARAAFTSTLKGFREGYFFGLTPAALKDLLVRFGPIIYYSSEDERWDTDSYGLLLGWEGSNWIKVVLSGNGYALAQSAPIEGASSKFDGIVILDTDAILCGDITVDTPVSLCSCPPNTDKVAFEADPRHELGPNCASGSMRAAWAVVVAALAIPALSLFL